MDDLLRDVRYGLRLLRRTPAFSMAIVLIVAIGVGAAATIFSIVESSLLWNENPNVDRWVMMRAFFPRRNMRVFSFSSGEYYDFRGLTDLFERVGAVHGINATLFVDQTPQVVEETFVSADMMPMTATPAFLGRIFTDEDDKPGAPASCRRTTRYGAGRSTCRSSSIPRPRIDPIGGCAWSDSFAKASRSGRRTRGSQSSRGRWRATMQTRTPSTTACR
jgi:hypothetical protein